MKVRDFFKRALVEGDVGVEIEVEGKNLPRAPEGWRAEIDGSLKAAEALEFVMTNPVPVEELGKALEELGQAFKKNKAVFDDSYRAGIHVHVNVQELSMIELATMISTYFVFETSLVNTCNPFRRGNHFCLRAKDAGYQVRKLQEAFVYNRPQLFGDEDIRYASMNVCSVPKYGSVEFRSLESTPDFKKVSQFAEMHYNLKKFATAVASPDKALHLLQQEGVGAFCKRVFGEYSDVLLQQPTFYQDCEAGLELAEDLAFCRPWGVRSLDIFALDKEVF